MVVLGLARFETAVTLSGIYLLVQILKENIDHFQKNIKYSSMLKTTYSLRHSN